MAVIGGILRCDWLNRKLASAIVKLTPPRACCSRRSNTTVQSPEYSRTRLTMPRSPVAKLLG